MLVACFDLEGVLIPEVWIAVSKKTGIQELSLTTRDISDYDELMGLRLKTLAKHGISLKEITEVIGTLEPMQGAKEFLDWVRARCQVIILSDTFYDFADPFMQKLGRPTIFCHQLVIENGFITGYKLRQPDQKRKAVEALRSINFSTVAIGDSYNDVSMIQHADTGIFFRAPQKVRDQFPQVPAVEDYESLKKMLEPLIQAATEIKKD